MITLVVGRYGTSTYMVGLNEYANIAASVNSKSATEEMIANCQCQCQCQCQ